MNQIFRHSIMLMLFALFSLNSFGQKCLTSVKKTQALESNSQLAIQLEEQEKATQRWVEENQFSTGFRSVETLPVVIHVIWRESQENISDEQIMSQLEVLNNDFRKLNDNFNTGPIAFQSLGADIEIEFCLASVDPSGNSTNGIVRSQTTIDDIGMTDSWYSTSAGGQDAWDINKYINIWVCDLGDDGTLGFATPPGFAQPAESDGMVIGHQYFGTVGTAANSQPNHLGRTATHEMGHYFNLDHVWGPNEGGCNEDDFVSDTPVQNADSQGCPTFPLLDNCTNSGNGVMFNNYLDYSDDYCMTMFTEGQKMRMLAALNGPRASLLTSNGCSTTTSIEEVAIIKPLIFPNPVKSKLTISFHRANPEKDTFSIFNSIGEKMLEFRAEKNLQIDITDFPDGIYFLMASNPSVGVQKIIVAK